MLCSYCGDAQGTPDRCERNVGGRHDFSTPNTDRLRTAPARHYLSDHELAAHLATNPWSR